jgi:tyrosyl-tRNA synthetase
LIEQGGVRVDGERRTRVDDEVALEKDQTLLVQVGKRRFLRVRGV